MEYRKGDRVNHRIYGPGTVLDVNPKKGAVKIKFDSLQTFRTIAGNYEGMRKEGVNNA